ncbi:MAG: hypothetical protein GY866_17675 [Proteobacteria bacterium]|nr:hypothetical protein [Pseudomonadota bacterium]
MDAHHWFVFKLTNSSPERVQRILRFDEPFPVHADIHHREGGKWHSERNGLVQPLGERPIPNRLPTFSVSLDAGETKSICRIRTLI